MTSDRLRLSLFKSLSEAILNCRCRVYTGPVVAAQSAFILVRILAGAHDVRWLDKVRVELFRFSCNFLLSLCQRGDVEGLVDEIVIAIGVKVILIRSEGHRRSYCTSWCNQKNYSIFPPSVASSALMYLWNVWSSLKSISRAVGTWSFTAVKRQLMWKPFRTLLVFLYCSSSSRIFSRCIGSLEKN